MNFNGPTNEGFSARRSVVPPGGGSSISFGGPMPAGQQWVDKPAASSNPYASTFEGKENDMGRYPSQGTPAGYNMNQHSYREPMHQQQTYRDQGQAMPYSSRGPPQQSPGPRGYGSEIPQQQGYSNGSYPQQQGYAVGAGGAPNFQLHGPPPGSGRDTSRSNGCSGGGGAGFDHKPTGAGAKPALFMATGRPGAAATSAASSTSGSATGAMTRRDIVWEQKRAKYFEKQRLRREGGASDGYPAATGGGNDSRGCGIPPGPSGGGDYGGPPPPGYYGSGRSQGYSGGSPYQEPYQQQQPQPYHGGGQGNEPRGYSQQPSGHQSQQPPMNSGSAPVSGFQHSAMLQSNGPPSPLSQLVTSSSASAGNDGAYYGGGPPVHDGPYSGNGGPGYSAPPDGRGYPSNSTTNYQPPGGAFPGGGSYSGSSAAYPPDSTNPGSHHSARRGSRGHDYTPRSEYSGAPAGARPGSGRPDSGRAAASAGGAIAYGGGVGASLGGGGGYGTYDPPPSSSRRGRGCGGGTSQISFG